MTFIFSNSIVPKHHKRLHNYCHNYSHYRKLHALGGLQKYKFRYLVRKGRSVPKEHWNYAFETLSLENNSTFSSNETKTEKDKLDSEESRQDEARDTEELEGIDRTSGYWDVIYESPAKVNLFLRILGKRKDGYHELATLMQAISLRDVLYFKLLGDSADGDIFETNSDDIPLGSSNFVIAAFRKFRKETGMRKYFHVRVEKRIPVKAGLGGGSSNAATALWAANYLTGKKYSVEYLQKWGADIGSDVPFFFSSGTAFCSGRGETVSNMGPLYPSFLYIIKPSGNLSTENVYQNLDLSKCSNRDPAELLTAVKEGVMWADPVNDLEEPSFRLYPLLSELKMVLQGSGFPVVLMCGSGSALFCLGAPSSDVYPIFEEGLREHYPVTIYTARFLNRNTEQNVWYLDPEEVKENTMTEELANLSARQSLHQRKNLSKWKLEKKGSDVNYNEERRLTTFSIASGKMVSGGTLVIAIVVPLVVPFGAAAFVLFFVLQYKRLRRLRIRLEVERRLAERAAGNGKVGVTRLAIKEQCPLVIYKGRTKFGKGPYKITKPFFSRNLEEESSDLEFPVKEVSNEHIITPPKSVELQFTPLRISSECSSSSSSNVKEPDGYMNVATFVQLAYSKPENVQHPTDTFQEMVRSSKTLDEVQQGQQSLSRTAPLSAPSSPVLHSHPSSRKNSRADALKEFLHMNIFRSSSEKQKEGVVGWTCHFLPGPVLKPSSIPGGVCSICMEDIKKGKKLRLLRCKHAFHARCVERWLLAANRCPLCNHVAVIPTEERSSLRNSTSADRNSRDTNTSFFQRFLANVREIFSDYPSDLPVLLDDEYNIEDLLSPRASEESLSHDGGDDLCRTSADLDEDSHHVVEFSHDDALASLVYESNLYFQQSGDNENRDNNTSHNLVSVSE
eukprot:jgi/Galph1/465/GphlegSOOS_G5267.1